jgi:hypothetical protein
MTAVENSYPTGYTYLEFRTRNTVIRTDHLILVARIPKARTRHVRKMRSEDRNKYWHGHLLEKVQSENQGSDVINKIGREIECEDISERN